MSASGAMVEESMLRALGRVVVNMNALEHWVGTWTGQLISWDPILGEIITCELSFRNLRALLSSLAKSISHLTMRMAWDASAHELVGRPEGGSDQFVR